VVGREGGLVVAVAHRGGVPLGRPTPSAVTVRADGLDGCFGGPLEPELRRRGRTHLLVAGLGLEGPVHSTLRSLNDRGYECLLVADACAPLDPAVAPAAAAMVTMSGGIFGAVGTVTPILRALTARHAPSGGGSPAPVPSPQEEP
jgi:nicotinamidase-related amidase